MEKFVPYAKLSKKARRRADREKRRTWEISPVTRRPQNPKAYKRKTGPVTDDGSAGLFFFNRDRSAAGCGSAVFFISRAAGRRTA